MPLEYIVSEFEGKMLRPNRVPLLPRTMHMEQTCSPGERNQ